MKKIIQTLFFFLLVTQFCFGQWVPTNGLDSMNVLCLAVSGTNIFAGTHSGFYGGGGVNLSTNNGTSWTAVNEGLPRSVNDTTRYSSIYCLATVGQNLFAATDSGVFLSTNNGTKWTAAGLTGVGCFAVSDTNLFAGGSGVFLSTDKGTSWTSVNEGLPRSLYDTTRYASILCFAASGQNLFCGTYGRGVFRSTNSGTSWAMMSIGLQDSYGVIYALAVSGTNIFAGTIRGIFLSTNNDTSWTTTSPALQANCVSAFAVSGTNIFAGTGYYLKADSPIGVFLTTDNGASWTAVNEGFPGGSDWDPSEYAGIHCFALIGQSLFAGTENGVWRRPLSEMITPVEDNQNTLPTNYSLSQNYPNPFNPSTKINWQLPVGNQVTLKVYDALGREVATLVNEYKQEGKYDVEWNASGFPSGVYFYQLKAGDYFETRKMILLK